MRLEAVNVQGKIIGAEGGFTGFQIDQADHTW